MKKQPIRKKNIRAIERLGELLRENVLDSFEWYGIGTTPVVVESASEAARPENDSEEHGEVEEDEDEHDEVEYYFDPADVQGALDEAISELIKEGLIPEFKNPKKPPTLADIFAVLFGTQSELKKQADYFEDLISGYEDRAHIDDLKEAYSVLEEIVDEIAPQSAKH